MNDSDRLAMWLKAEDDVTAARTRAAELRKEAAAIVKQALANEKEIKDQIRRGQLTMDTTVAPALATSAASDPEPGLAAGARAERAGAAGTLGRGGAGADRGGGRGAHQLGQACYPWLTIGCPRCYAAVGESCRSSTGRAKKLCQERGQDAAHLALATNPPEPAIAEPITINTALIDLLTGADVSAAGRALEEWNPGVPTIERLINRCGSAARGTSTISKLGTYLRNIPKLGAAAANQICDALVDAGLVTFEGFNFGWTPKPVANVVPAKKSTAKPKPKTKAKKKAG